MALSRCSDHVVASPLWPSSLVLLILLISYPASVSSSSVSNDGNNGSAIDRLALLSFKSQILDDPHRALASWGGEESHDLCGWRGVTCAGGHQLRVTALDLDSLDLAGSISPSLANLTFLQRLHLPSNRLDGYIPPELGFLPHLQHLNLSLNSLKGGIPATLSHCTLLQNISMNENRLSGGIPPFLGNLSSLAILSLAFNQLTGGIPPSLGYLSFLAYLDLSFNNLKGAIPPSLWNLSSLAGLWLSNNNLTGALPPDMGQILPRLQMLGMSDNQFYGPIPMSLSNASRLESIELGYNKLGGTIPSTLGSLPSLSKLLLDGNQLEARTTNDWSFLGSLSNCSRLRILNLEYNMLGGVLPNSIANLSTGLELLSMNDNHISGSIPAGIGNLLSLTVLPLSANLITGTIPATVGRLQKLHQIELDYNMLSGKIPSTLGNLTQLNELYLGFNNLTGSIPTALGSCQHLELLDISYNYLSSTIPMEILNISSLSRYLSFSHNSLTGSIPMEVGSLVNLERIDFSENQLSGEIPSTLGECQVLQYLYMRGNYFNGTIPSSFSQLRGIQELDLSNNNLSGHIPEFLGSFQLLTNLNLSFNNFEGEVPKDGVFGNLSAVSVLGNNKLCGGNPKLNLTPCPKETPRKKHWSPRLTIIVSVVSAALCFILLFCLFAARYRIHKSRRVPSITTWMEDQHMKVSYGELLKATDGFSSTNLIGMGSFGSVYKGIMDYNDHNVVAVKVLNLEQRGASKSFIAECEALRNIRHRNLIKILTTCSSTDFKGNDFKALVFEYLPNGSLDKWLHHRANDQRDQRNLSLIQRLNIAIDVASALDYLHNHGSVPIVHCDLKPSNVLLDNDMIAHVGDFGLARFLTKNVGESSQRSTSSIVLKGSVGYAAPEYGMGNRLSTQGDVYSYGILVLEMFTGKGPTNDTFNEGLSLHRFVEMAFTEQVMNIADPFLFLEGSYGEANATAQDVDDVRGKLCECITAVLRVGVMCSKQSPMERMQIRDAIKEIQEIRKAFLGIGI